MTLLTVEDVKNELGIDLIKVKGGFAQSWINSQVDEVLFYIGQFAYGGYPQALRMLEDDYKKGIICKATLKHIEYLATNNFVEPDNIITKKGQEYNTGIAIRARELLMASGLLFCGRY